MVNVYVFFLKLFDIFLSFFLKLLSNAVFYRLFLIFIFFYFISSVFFFPAGAGLLLFWSFFFLKIFTFFHLFLGLGLFSDYVFNPESRVCLQLLYLSFIIKLFFLF